MSGEAAVPEDERGRWLYVTVFWISAVMAVVSVFVILYAVSPDPRKPPPSPAPWSCQSEMAKLSTIDGGGAIAPVCGASPYPGSVP